MTTINPAGNGGWIQITSKYPNKCKICEKDIDVDEKCLWKKGDGVKHIKPCEKEEDIGFREDNSALIIVDAPLITDKEWKDFNTYSYRELQKIKNCQKCGTSLPDGDSYINCDRRTCFRCFSA